MTSARGIAHRLEAYEGDDWWGLLGGLADAGLVDVEATRATNDDGELRRVVLADGDVVGYDPASGEWTPLADPHGEGGERA